jgi:hypothetical protein
MDSRLVGLSVLHVLTDIRGLVAQAIVLSTYVRRLYLTESRAEFPNRATNPESTKSPNLIFLVLFCHANCIIRVGI